MRRIGMAGALLVALFALNAVASAWAAGPVWLVNGVKLESGKTEALKGEASSSYTLTGKALGFVEIAVTCKKAKTTGVLVGGEPGTDGATIRYTECTSNSGLCTPVEPIETKVDSEVVYYQSGGKGFIGDLLFAKESSGVIATIECSLGLTAEVTGSIVGELLSEGKEKIEKEHEAIDSTGYLSFAGAKSVKYTNSKGEEKTAELKWEGTTATLTGTSEVKLSSGKTFGASVGGREVEEETIESGKGLYKGAIRAKGSGTFTVESLAWVGGGGVVKSCVGKNIPPECIVEIKEPPAVGDIKFVGRWL
jgi:hypothetical protein